MSIKDLINAEPAKRSYPAIVPGTYQAHVIEASYAKNQAGTSYRTQVKVQIDGPGEQTGSWKNLYLNQGKDLESSARNLRPWITILTAAGIPETAILPEGEEDIQEIIQNVSVVILKALRKGMLIKLEISVKANPADATKPWLNVQPVGSVTPVVETIKTDVATPAQLAAFATASAPASNVADLARAQTSTAAQAGFVAESQSQGF